jgi:hypothetical protein
MVIELSNLLINLELIRTHIFPQNFHAKISLLNSFSIFKMTVEGLEPADIPVVDMSLLQGTPEEERAALKLLDNAFQSCGFAYISNHGISEEFLNEARSYVCFLHIS